MLNVHLPVLASTLKMVKNKKDLKSPRRNRSLTGCRAGTRPRQNVARTAGGNIRVVIRVRPFNERENCNNNKNIIKVVDEHTMIFDPKEDDEPFFYHGVQQRNRDIMKRANKNLNFTFDHVFGDDVNNEDIFNSSTKTLIDTLMKGFNCSVFVYGATGAGKTFTMLGRKEDPGITFLTMSELFRQKEELLQERDFELGITYLEVYNETVQDLLNPGPALSLREDGKYGVVVSGIKMHRIEHSCTLFELLEQGNRNRTQHPTDANSESSRSHAVFQVYLRMKFKASGEIRIAKLSMIDLAGSERGAATGFSGARFTEGANINKSLLALGNCINSLADGHRHVPYRDSKLTRLLKDSLGGNCQTVMIANISPSSFNYEDTYNTLKYAMRAKKIKSSLKKNVLTSESSLNHYIQVNDELTKEVEGLKLKLSLCTCRETVVQKVEVEVSSVVTVNNENAQLKNELEALFSEKTQLEQRLDHLESTMQLNLLRKQLKQETDSRLSGISTDSAEKKQYRDRLGSRLDRLERQTSTIQEDIRDLTAHMDNIDSQIKTFLDKNPHLTHISEIENARISCVKANNKVEHLQKFSDLQNRELRMRDHLIGRFSEVLKPCFLQLRGHGFATAALSSKYNDLVRHLQGVRTVSWDDELTGCDTAVTSTTVEVGDETRPSKTKSAETTELDKTFLVPEQKSPICPQLTTKVINSLSDDSNLEANRTFDIVPVPVVEEELLDEVFHDGVLESNTNRNAIGNVCAKGMMFRVTKPSTQDHKVGLVSQNFTPPPKPVSAKRLMTNVYKSSSAECGATSSRFHKENKVPRLNLPKQSDKDIPSKSPVTLSTDKGSSSSRKYVYKKSAKFMNR